MVEVCCVLDGQALGGVASSRYRRRTVQVSVPTPDATQILETRGYVCA
jgi:hypothetical protein